MFINLCCSLGIKILPLRLFEIESRRQKYVSYDKGRTPNKNVFEIGNHLKIFNNSIPTAKKSPHLTIININLLMLFKKMILFTVSITRNT